MRKVMQESHGGPEVLRVTEAAIPEPGPGEVLVRVEAAGIALPDLLRLKTASPLPAPVGGELVGEVMALGPDVRGIGLGERVAGVTPHGALADYAVAPAGLVSRVPRAVDPVEAVVIARSGLVALGAVEAARVAGGERVLVTGAAGGVGHLAVQIARGLGARVVGAVDSPEKAEFVRGLGAERAMSYEDGWDGGFDAVLDAVGGEVLRKGIAALKPFGRAVTFSAEGALVDTYSLRPEMKSLTGFAVGTLARHRPSEVERMRAQLWRLHADGAVKPQVHARLALQRVSDGFEMLDTRKNMGRVVIVP
ncbi:oxidoreductase [Actinorhabdospora filicis]|uniref:Oxidoreductase n=1 Tax=Actinorhabdospora filicis TaxID=1785913 RepID=A0A9W6STU6_9ACTN|nr:zinc-binding dehydrogenase [Actinorhabdospora filicis]GLZ81958.1 oxidoreductase [Actinorhabdospora filicis]